MTLIVHSLLPYEAILYFLCLMLSHVLPFLLSARHVIVLSIFIIALYGTPE